MPQHLLARPAGFLQIRCRPLSNRSIRIAPPSCCILAKAAISPFSGVALLGSRRRLVLGHALPNDQSKSDNGGQRDQPLCTGRSRGNGGSNLRQLLASACKVLGSTAIVMLATLVGTARPAYAQPRYAWTFGSSLADDHCFSARLAPA